jgi:ATP-dependent RNA helicase DeaD
MNDAAASSTGFHSLNLPANLLSALEESGYETPSPIQAEAIPFLLEGQDLLGNAPTGTGKTAAFALPLLSRLTDQGSVQVLVLTPTRELAIQVAEAFQRYAVHLSRFHVLPVYGGQEYGSQIRALKRGVQVVVGTPGRIMDHMRKGTLKLGELQALVLDEADEMLRMGFIDDVEWILEQTPKQRQMALFSATMPAQVKRIATRYLNDPKEIRVVSKTATAETIRQRYWLVSHLHKLDALTRILEVEPFDAMLMFVRTKLATAELAERLEARGYAAAALNGDMPQKSREQMISRLKNGQLDILVATDVAARGLDVDRISHVVNYDIPYDTEAYIHRIGRTGRAGRTGDAILFVSPREQRMLKSIERATRQKIEPLELPTQEMVNSKRIDKFKQSITSALESGELAFMQNILEQYEQEHDVPALDIAAALAKMLMGDRSLLLEEQPPRGKSKKPRKETGDKPARKPKSANSEVPEGMERFRLEVGHDHEVKPGNIVGAIANEAGVDAEHIGHVDIRKDHSLVDLPLGMPRDIFRDLKKAWVCGQQLKISRLESRKKTPFAQQKTAATKKHKKKRSKKDA